MVDEVIDLLSIDTDRVLGIELVAGQCLKLGQIGRTDIRRNIGNRRHDLYGLNAVLIADVDATCRRRRMPALDVDDREAVRHVGVRQEDCVVGNVSAGG